MTATHHGREFVREGLPGSCGANVVDTFNQQIARRSHLHCERGVEDVGGSQTLVHPACGGANGRGDIFKKGNDIMVGPLLDLEDLGDGKLSLFADGLGVGSRNLAETGHRLAGEGLDLEPDFVFALVRPERAHLRLGITVDHQRILSERRRTTNP